jgi:hypothetical protein
VKKNYPTGSVSLSVARSLARSTRFALRALQERGLDIWIYVRREVSLPAFARSCVARSLSRLCKLQVISCTCSGGTRAKVSTLYVQGARVQTFACLGCHQASVILLVGRCQAHMTCRRSANCFEVYQRGRISCST